MIRSLTQSDAAQLEAFLAQHRDSSMFLRSNARRAGLEFHGEALQAHYVAAFRGSEIVAVVAHSWSGMVLVQAPGGMRRGGARLLGRERPQSHGLFRTLAHVQEARAALGLADAATRTDFADRLYALELSALCVPPMLTSGAVTCRAPQASERELLCAWRLAYDIELLGADDSVESRKRAAAFLDSPTTRLG